MLTAAYLQSGVTVIGVGTELDAIAAVVIGGTLLTGGAGTVLGTAVGMLLRNVISNIINQVGGLDSNIQSVISGAGGRGAAAGAVGRVGAPAAQAVVVPLVPLVPLVGSARSARLIVRRHAGWSGSGANPGPGRRAVG